MHDDARFGRQLLNRHAPFFGGVVEQDAAHLRAKCAQRHVIAPHRVAARGVHHALEARIAIDRLDRRRSHDLDLRPVGIEFLGEDQRQRGHRPLPHLGGRGHDADGAVVRNADPWTERLAGARGGQGRCVGAAGQREGERKTRRADHHLAAGQCGMLEWLVHVTPPAPRARPRARCADKCRNGRCWYSCARRSRRGSASASA